MGGGADIVNEFISGTVGGVLQAAASHPFDTLKGRIQKGEFHGITEGFGYMAKHEGLTGFYRGVTPPLFIMGFYNSLLFGINQIMTELVQPADFKPGDQLSLGRVALAAQMTSPFMCAAIVPFEMCKVKLQTQPSGADKLYSGPIDCLTKVAKQHGPFGLMAGYVPYTISHITGLPPFFIGAQAGKNVVIDNKFASEDSVWAGMAGGVGAAVANTPTAYPFDLLKARVQASPVHLSMTRAAQDIYRQRGLAGFVKGMDASLIRNIPANVAVWVGVDFTKRQLEVHGL